MSISVVVTTLPEFELADGNQDVQTTVHEALNIHYDRWANEERVIRNTWEVIQNNSDVIKAVNNTASEILALLDT